MSEAISVELHAQDKVKQLGVTQLMMLPYRSSSHITRHYMDDGDTSLSGGNGRTSPDHNLSLLAASPAASQASPTTSPKAPVATSSANSQPSSGHPTIVLAITMPHEMGVRSWRWYEATIETLAVGVYLYATFTLTSLQFLSGNTGLTFVTIMALCSSVVRILENIFWSPR